MTAVASPPSFQQPHSRQVWSSNGQHMLNSMDNEVSSTFMPRKGAQRQNSFSPSSNSSTSSSGTVTNVASQPNGTLAPINDPGSNPNNNTFHRKKPQRDANRPWPISKAEPTAGVSAARPQSILATNGVSASSSMSQMQQHSVLPSQQAQTPTQQQNGARPGAQPTEATPMLYLLSQNGTFERKTINVPYYPDNLRIGRQTNAKTVPTATNGYFDSKVLSRQHAEIWAERSGKIWIRDVRSSNGTFVNGTRLSAENRDSEPHELQTGDHLELGIDIVSEDQKTVVHHKVAAKIEHAGFLGATNNVMDMNFGDLDPANGTMMQPQNPIMRGRTNTQSTIQGNPRANAMQMAGPVQQRPMNFWLTPITTEAIVKRLAHEMRQARLVAHDLASADQFMETLVSSSDFNEKDRIEESLSRPGSFMSNGQPVVQMDAVVNRFSDPPAPPPQQPLPAKPDAPARLQTGDASLKRSNTERPRSQTTSPVKQDNSSQVVTLLEALKTAKKEIESQGDRMRELEEALQQEREARREAEELAKKLENESSNGIHINGVVKDGGAVEGAFNPPPDSTVDVDGPMDENINGIDEEKTETVGTEAKRLQEKLELMMAEMREMKQQMETCRQRTEDAEQERDDTRKTLAEMVQKIRDDEEARRVKKSAKNDKAAKKHHETKADVENYSDNDLDFEDAMNEKLPNGIVVSTSDIKDTVPEIATALQTYPPAESNVLAYTSPYASMLGVVLLGLGLMTYLNGGFQKVDRVNSF